MLPLSSPSFSKGPATIFRSKSGIGEFEVEEKRAIADKENLERGDRFNKEKKGERGDSEKNFDFIGLCP